MTVQRFRVRSRGADLSCVRFGAGEPLLYLHALAYSKEHAVAAAEILGERFDCVAFDQRGHGDTRGLAGTGGHPPFDLDAMVADALAVLDHAGFVTAIVGGTSMGAGVALRFALTNGVRLTHLVQDLPAFGPRSPRDATDADQVARAFEQGDLEMGARRATGELSSRRGEALARELLSQWRHFDARELAPKLATAFRGTLSWDVTADLPGGWPEALEQLAMPATLIALKGDASHPYEVAETMSHHLPNARLVPRVPALDPRKSFVQWVALLGDQRRS